MSFWSQSFDVWSSRSKLREGKLIPACNDQSAANFDGMFRTMSSSESQTLKYFEKMPEHILRVPEILQLFRGEARSIKFVYVERDWLPVALSIHRLCADSTRQSRWFGF